MGAKHFTELEAWKRADELRRHVFAMTSTDPARRDFAFRDQLRSSTDSACDNIAEGFGRYSHRDFSRFLTIAKGSLDESESQLLGGLGKGYFSEGDVKTARVEVAEARRALLGLKRYLDRTTPPKPFSSK